MLGGWVEPPVAPGLAFYEDVGLPSCVDDGALLITLHKGRCHIIEGVRAVSAMTFFPLPVVLKSPLLTACMKAQQMQRISDSK